MIDSTFEFEPDFVDFILSPEAIRGKLVTISRRVRLILRFMRRNWTKSLTLLKR